MIYFSFDDKLRSGKIILLFIKVECLITISLITPCKKQLATALEVRLRRNTAQKGFLFNLII